MLVSLPLLYLSWSLLFCLLELLVYHGTHPRIIGQSFENLKRNQNIYEEFAALFDDCSKL
jgi:hypothetical protein